MNLSKILFGIIFIILAVVISSCCMSGKKHKKYEFTDEEREWLIYNKGDTLTFLSSNGDFEQFYVRSVYDEFVRRPEKFSCDIVENENYEVFFDFVKPTSDYRTFSFRLNSDYFSSYIEWYGFGFSSFHELPLNSYELNGRVFNDVWERPIQNNITKEWIKLIYSKSAGLLRYEFSDGKVCERVF